ncbi:hypothetical protein Q9189_005248 [Teloschistes chrysophthalmus]
MDRHDIGCLQGRQCRCMKPAARISAFQRERDLVKKAKAALENIPVAALFNIFHEPYPTIQHDEFQGNSKEATTSNDRLSTLPTEIFDLVMMNLSPPALDAARYVCRSWRTKIMTSTIVLRTVLGSQRREKAQASGIEWLRLLRRDFDRQSDLIQCWNHPDVWRTRYRQCSGLHPNVRPNSTYAHSLRQTLNHKQRQLPSNISGKRIRSLDSNAGGVHSASPLWRNPEERTTREHQTNLGGLAILQTDEKVLFPLGTKATHQAVFAWGPGSDQVDLSIFDLSYANHNLEQLPARFYGSTDSTWYKRAAYHLTKHDPQLSGIPYNGILCQCAMHDDGYKVILPNDGRQRTATRAGVESRTIWNLWYGPRVPTAAATEGCVEHYDSPARAKAWARRDEWLQQRIEIMKGVGLSDKEISIAWKEQLWTRSGLFDRPDRRKETKP